MRQIRPATRVMVKAMRFKLFGTEVYISFLFAAVVALMLTIDRTGLVIPTLFAVFIHETGHLFAMWVTECAPKRIRLIPASVQIVRSFSIKPHGEIAIALCGPLANLVLFLTLFLNYLSFGNETVLNFALLNLIIGIFNLLPVCGLDGGTILTELLCRKTEPYKAIRAVRIITGIFAFLTLFAGVFMTLNGRFNLSVFIVALYFIVTAILKM